jgi:hypothetical protein
LYYSIYVKISRKGKTIETQSRLVVAWSWRWEPGVPANRHEGAMQGDESFLKPDHGAGCTAA